MTLATSSFLPSKLMPVYLWSVDLHLLYKTNDNSDNFIACWTRGGKKWLHYSNPDFNYAQRW